MKITIQTIKHEEQRYDTVGDYWEDADGTMQFRITDTGNKIVNFMCLMHELTEWFWCVVRGLPLESVDTFDLNHLDAEEPGCLSDAPYHEGHELGEVVEKVLENGLGISHKEVDEAYSPFY